MPSAVITQNQSQTVEDRQKAEKLGGFRIATEQAGGSKPKPDEGSKFTKKDAEGFSLPIPGGTEGLA